MNKNLMGVESGTATVPMTNQTDIAVKVETISIKEVEALETKSLKIKKRFERMRKTLRKRSYGIL